MDSKSRILLSQQMNHKYHMNPSPLEIQDQL